MFLKRRKSTQKSFINGSPKRNRVLLASIRAAFGDYLLADLKDLKAVVALEQALEPLTTGNPALAPHELSVRAAIHAKLSAARARLGQHTPHASRTRASRAG